MKAIKDDDWMNRLAGLTGLRHYSAQEYKVEGLRHCLVGAREGYIVVIGSRVRRSRTDARRLARLFIRFSPTNENVTTKALRGCKEGFEGSKLTFEAEWSGPEEEEPVRSDVSAGGSKKTGSGFEVSILGHKILGTRKGEAGDSDKSNQVDSITWHWEFEFGQPEPEQVLTLLESCLLSLKEFAPPLPQVCEICKKTSISELTLRNGTPGYYCDACQEKQTRRFRRQMEEYEQQDVDHVKGLVYGLGAALVTGLVAGYLAALALPKVSDDAAFFIVFVASGMIPVPVFFATQAGLRRIDDAGAEITLATCLLGVFLAHVFYYISFAWLLTSQDLGLWLLRPALALFLGEAAFHVLSLLGSLLMAFYCTAAGGLRYATPSPDVTFERLNAPPSGEANPP